MNLQEWVPFVSAGAASLAALLAGINLWLTGKRADISWRRSALEHAFVDFLTAHYDHWDACNGVIRSHSGLSGHSSEADLVSTAREADTTMMRCVTRFRVLASPQMAKTALALRRFNDDDLDAIESGSIKALIEDGHVETSMATREAIDREREQARDTFVDQARQVLRISH